MDSVYLIAAPTRQTVRSHQRVPNRVQQHHTSQISLHPNRARQRIIVVSLARHKPQRAIQRTRRGELLFRVELHARIPRTLRSRQQLLAQQSPNLQPASVRLHIHPLHFTCGPRIARAIAACVQRSQRDAPHPLTSPLRQQNAPARRCVLPGQCRKFSVKPLIIQRKRQAPRVLAKQSTRRIQLLGRDGVHDAHTIIHNSSLATRSLCDDAPHAQLCFRFTTCRNRRSSSVKSSIDFPPAAFSSIATNRHAQNT